MNRYEVNMSEQRTFSYARKLQMESRNGEEEENGIIEDDEHQMVQ